MRRVATGLISWYRHALSPYVPGACRYTPTCSHYLQEAIERYGVMRGVGFTVGRLFRCNPFGGRGYDPVP